MGAIGGLVVALLTSVPLLLWLTRSGTVRLDPEPWHLSDTAKQHVTIMGGLAGFAVTGIVLIVSFARVQAVSTVALDTVVVMFAAAYFFYVGNAFLISYAPSGDAGGDRAHRIHFALASSIEYRTLFVSWFALIPLFEAHGLSLPADVLSYLLPVSLLLGSAIIAMAADGLGLVSVNETYIAAATGTALALLYAALAWFGLPGLRDPYSAMAITVAVFVANLVGFAVAAFSPLSQRYPAVARFYERHSRRVGLIDMQLTMTVLAFLWLAVSGII